VTYAVVTLKIAGNKQMLAQLSSSASSAIFFREQLACVTDEIVIRNSFFPTVPLSNRETAKNEHTQKSFMLRHARAINSFYVSLAQNANSMFNEATRTSVITVKPHELLTVKVDGGVLEGF
jgi:hypothetical protein